MKVFHFVAVYSSDTERIDKFSLIATDVLSWEFKQPNLFMLIVYYTSNKTLAIDLATAAIHVMLIG